MATTTTKPKSGFKDSMQKAGQKTKDFAKKKTEQVKTYGKNYKSDVRKAYDVGYSRGWDDAYDIPQRFLCKLAAGIGYRKGIKNRYKSDKYIKQYNKQGKQKINKEN